MEDLELTLIGPNPNETQGGGVRTNTLLTALRPLEAKISQVYYSFQKKRFKIRSSVDARGCRVVEMDFPNAWPKVLKLTSLVVISAYAWKQTKTTRLVVCTFGSMLFAIPAIIISKRRGKPIILDYIDTELYGVPEFICRYFLAKAELVYAISHYLINQATHYGARNILYIPTFVDSSFFRVDPEGRQKYRDTLGIIPSTILIGYAGSLAPFEGLNFLLEAYKNILNKHSNARLVFVGKKLLETDSDIPALAGALGIGENVRLVSPVSREQYPKLLSAFDILCVPRTDCEMSRAANPIKVTEYMSMGIPVVCSAIGEMALIIRDGENGFLAKPNDASDLADKLDYVITNLEVAKQAGIKARRDVIEKYSDDRIGNQIRTSVEDFIREKNNDF